MEISRRKFMRNSAKAAVGVGAIATIPLLASCSPASNKRSGNKKNLAMLRVSSDPYVSYKESAEQRFAFSIFEGESIRATKDLDQIEFKSPSGRNEVIKNVKLREKGIKGQGIYSVSFTFFEAGNWKLTTSYDGTKLELPFVVAEKSTAPAIKSAAPISKTPTKSNPLDATVLCTAFEGECELHDHSIDELATTKKPYVVLFATPARCQTAYCGPVLDLTREVAKKSDIDVVHIEIYKNETSNETLDAVQKWNLPSEPWMFGVTADGKIDWRLDGAFDQSEIEELFKRLK